MYNYKFKKRPISKSIKIQYTITIISLSKDQTSEIDTIYRNSEV